MWRARGPRYSNVRTSRLVGPRAPSRRRPTAFDKPLHTFDRLRRPAPPPALRLADHFFFAHRIDGDRHAFDAEEARHATRVLRLRVGDDLQWLDGRGGRYTGVLVAADACGMTAVARSELREPPPPRLDLAVGLLHDATRLEWLVEKAVELGATRIVLLRTARVGRTRHRGHRLKAKALSAMKQSGRAFLPEVVERNLGAWLRERPEGRLLFGHCYADLPRRDLASVELGRESAATTLAIGPEGDFAPDEVEALTRAGGRAFRLSAARLRTETAAIAALAILTARRTLAPPSSR